MEDTVDSVSTTKPEPTILVDQVTLCGDRCPLREMSNSLPLLLFVVTTILFIVGYSFYYYRKIKNKPEPAVKTTAHKSLFSKYVAYIITMFSLPLFLYSSFTFGFALYYGHVSSPGYGVIMLATYVITHFFVLFLLVRKTTRGIVRLFNSNARNAALFTIDLVSIVLILTLFLVVLLQLVRI